MASDRDRGKKFGQFIAPIVLLAKSRTKLVKKMQGL
jgi:hypothetical protein